MTANPEYGHTHPGAVKNLPEVVFDLSEGQAPSSAFGKTETAVHLLPEMAGELMPPEEVPVLELSLSLRPGATPLEVALDLFRLYAAVNRLERSYRGAGLTPDDASCQVTPTGGKMSLRFKPTEPAGALERLTRLVRTINEAVTDSADDAGSLRYRSIERCEAQVIPTAA